MNLINATTSQISLFSNWIDSTTVPQIIDSVTYDLYESSNPLRQNFNKNDISNKGLRIAANTSATVGAEIFSAFANPYYLMHKIVNIPTAYNSVVETYRKHSQG